jgi:menaquinone-dependent protoporphyrinogen IX oxidase
MKSILLVYKSKTGFTKKYVDWIVEEFPCETIPLDKLKANAINNYDIIIYGAGMHAGHIFGLKEFKKMVDFTNKKIIVFATGGAPYTEEITAKIKKNNFTDIDAATAFFYFESGINYERMGVVDKTMMSIFTKVLDAKTNKSDLEEGTRSAKVNSYDHSNKEYIQPLTTYLRGLLGTC